MSAAGGLVIPGGRMMAHRSRRNVGVPVEYSPDSVRRLLPDGRCEELSWIDLAEVRVITNADGPFAEDVFFVLTAADGVRGVAVLRCHVDIGTA
jgi:hypothetical protein